MPAPRTAALLLGAATGVHAHGAMLTPVSRNAIDSTLPGFNWGNGSTKTGVLEPLSVKCTNGTDACHPGQSVFWFSQGCTPGCDSCDGQGQRIANWDHCNVTRTEPFKPTLHKKYWSANRNATEGSPQDIWKYQPWRSPGLAPVNDACGMAGGNPTAMCTPPAYRLPPPFRLQLHLLLVRPLLLRYNGAEYKTTPFAKQGDLGSRVLPPRPSGTNWVAGGVANVSWYIAFNHGGGCARLPTPHRAPMRLPTPLRRDLPHLRQLTRALWLLSSAVQTSTGFALAPRS